MSKLIALRSSYHGDAIDKTKDGQRLREWLAFVKIGFMSYELAHSLRDADVIMML